MIERTTIVLPASATPELQKLGQRYRIVAVQALAVTFVSSQRCGLWLEDGGGNVLSVFWSTALPTPNTCRLSWAAASSSQFTTSDTAGTIDTVTGVVATQTIFNSTEVSNQTISIPERLIVETSWQPYLRFEPGDGSDSISSTWTVELEPKFRE